MASSQEYRRYAKECLRWAGEADDEAQRQQFLDMAALWAQAASLAGAKLPTPPKAPPALPQEH